MGDGTKRVLAQNVLDDYTAIYLNGTEQNGTFIFRCASGLGPSDNNTNDVIGDIYFNNTPLTDNHCNGLVEATGAMNITRYPGVYNARVCGKLTTSTEGVYTCTLMNSSMMNESVSVGIYFEGRSKLL